MVAEKCLHRQKKRVKNAKTIHLFYFVVDCMAQTNIVKADFCRLMITYYVVYCGC